MQVNIKECDKRSLLQELDEYPVDVLLEAVLAKAGCFGADETQFRSKLVVLNSLISMNNRIAEASAPCLGSVYPRTATISAVHASLSAPEFHAIEYTSYGPPTRWTGPSTHFSFDVFLDRSVVLGFVLEFEVVCFAGPVNAIKCFVDGQEVELLIEKGGGGYLVSGIIPTRQVQSASVITFVCPDVKSPREYNLPDDRLLGVRFRRLSIEETRPRALDSSPLRIV